MPASKWSKEDKARLMEWHSQGLTTAEIAVRLGRTREAVIGKLHRTGILTREKNDDNPETEKPRRRRDEFIYSGPLQDITITGGVEPDSMGVPLLKATDEQCHWPLEGKAGDGGPRCCGEPREGKSPYCAFHDERARLPKAAGQDTGAGRG